MGNIDFVKISENNRKEFHHLLSNPESYVAWLAGQGIHRTTYLYELLQNAEDGRATSVVVEVAQDRLLFYHDGKPFDEEDVLAITSPRIKPLSIGHYGYGFSSIYLVTNRPAFYSDDEAFQIIHLLFPEQVPEGWDYKNACETLEYSAADGSSFYPFKESKHLTRIEVPFKKEVEGEAIDFSGEAWSVLSALPDTFLLFFRNIRNLYCLDQGTRRVRQLLVNKEHAQETWVRSYHSDHPGVLREYKFLVYGGVYNLRQMPQTRVKIAYQINPDREEILPASQPSLFNTFPLKEKTELPFLANGPFVLSVPREQMNDHSAFNEEVKRCLANLVARSMGDLSLRGLLTESFLRNILVPAFLDEEKNGSIPGLKEELTEIFQNRAILPDASGTPCRRENLCLAVPVELRDQRKSPLFSSAFFGIPPFLSTGTQEDPGFYEAFQWMKDDIGLPVFDFLDWCKNLSGLPKKLEFNPAYENHLHAFYAFVLDVLKTAKAQGDRVVEAKGDDPEGQEAYPGDYDGILQNAVSLSLPFLKKAPIILNEEGCLVPASEGGKSLLYLHVPSRVNLVPAAEVVHHDFGEIYEELFSDFLGLPSFDTTYYLQQAILSKYQVAPGQRIAFERPDQYLHENARDLHRLLSYLNEAGEEKAHLLKAIQESRIIKTMPDRGLSPLAAFSCPRMAATSKVEGQEIAPVDVEFYESIGISLSELALLGVIVPEAKEEEEEEAAVEEEREEVVEEVVEEEVEEKKEEEIEEEIEGIEEESREEERVEEKAMEEVEEEVEEEHQGLSSIPIEDALDSITEGFEEQEVPVAAAGTRAKSAGTKFTKEILQHAFEGLWDQIRDEVQDEVKATVHDEVYEEVRSQVRSEVLDEVKAEVRVNVQDEVRAEIRRDILGEVKDEVRTAVRDEVKAEIRRDIFEEVKADVRAEVQDEVRAEIRRDILGEVKEEVRAAVQGEVKAEVREEIMPEVRDEVREEVRGKVREEILEEVRNELRTELRGEVLDEVRLEVHDEVLEEIKTLVREEVLDSVKQSVHDEVLGEVKDNVRLEVLDEVRDAVHEEVLEDVKKDVRLEVMADVKNDIRLEVMDEVRDAVHEEVLEDVKKDVRLEVLDEVRNAVHEEVLEDVKKAVRLEVMADVKNNIRLEVMDEVRNAVHEEVLEDVKKKVRIEVMSDVKRSIRREIMDDVKEEVRVEVLEKALEAIGPSPTKVLQRAHRKGAKPSRILQRTPGIIPQAFEDAPLVEVAEKEAQGVPEEAAEEVIEKAAENAAEEVGTEVAEEIAEEVGTEEEAPASESDADAETVVEALQETETADETNIEADTDTETEPASEPEAEPETELESEPETESVASTDSVEDTNTPDETDGVSSLGEIDDFTDDMDYSPLGMTPGGDSQDSAPNLFYLDMFAPEVREIVADREQKGTIFNPQEDRENTIEMIEKPVLGKTEVAEAMEEMGVGVTEEIPILPSAQSDPLAAVDRLLAGEPVDKEGRPLMEENDDIPWEDPTVDTKRFFADDVRRYRRKKNEEQPVEGAAPGQGEQDSAEASDTASKAEAEGKAEEDAHHEAKPKTHREKEHRDSENPAKHLHVGTRVTHLAYGQGKVTRILGKIVFVNYPGTGTKVSNMSELESGVLRIIR